MNNSKDFSLSSVLIIILLIVNIVAVVFTAVNQSKLEDKFNSKLMQVEYDRAGGKEAYDVDIQLRKLLVNHPDNPQNIKAQKELFAQLSAGKMPEIINDGAKTDTSATDEAPLNNSEPLTSTMMDTIMKTAVFENDVDNKDIVVIEYSDMECPFCVKQHNTNKIKENLMKDYGNKITFAFKNHMWVNHEGTEVKALWALCANKVGGKDLYVKFYDEVFNYSATHGDYYPVDKLSEIIKNAGANVDEWQSCVDSREFHSQFMEETREAVKLGMGGTPSTLIFNKKTGKFDTVIGAYPYSEFKKVIEKLSN